MVKTVLMIFLAVAFLSSTAFSLCLDSKPTAEEYAEADRKFGVSQENNREFALEDAQAIMYAEKTKEDEFKSCVSREEDALRKSGQDRYVVTPAGNFTYRFDKITGKTWISTPQGYRELKEMPRRE
ncbi:hypothetical protein [Solidesulfovibrio sp.]